MPSEYRTPISAVARCGNFFSGFRLLHTGLLQHGYGGLLILIGIDDTDAPTGGCTTHLLTAVLAELEELDIDLVGYPRLVRLNPCVSWKTRGNGAVALHVEPRNGRPENASGGARFLVGELDGAPVNSYRANGTSERDPAQISEVGARVAAVIDRVAHLDAENTHPGLVVTDRHYREEWYWRALHEVLRPSDLDEVLVTLERDEHTYLYYPKTARGLIGALAALAWPAHRRTYELIAYRRESRWGTPRSLDRRSVVAMDRAFPSTFDNYDPLNEQVIIAPHSPCPVLYGIRGTDPTVLPDAMVAVESEGAERWLVYETNQATDDHLVPYTGALAPHSSLVLPGTVAGAPRTIPGSHVIVPLRYDNANAIDCAAYEPTKQFREVVRALHVGDEVTMYGSIRAEPETMNIEKLQLRTLAHIEIKIANPPCPHCGKNMKSAGRDQGYRCRRCGTRCAEDDAVMAEKKRALACGFYEVPVCARRHLSKPLKLMREESEV